MGVLNDLAGDHFLSELFERQAELNERVGKPTGSVKHRLGNIDDPDLKQQLKIEVGSWINDYLIAMTNEVEELRDCTFWKHWCREAQDGRRFELHDLQNARVEVIDMLFFWISLAQCVGLDAKDVYELYLKKLGVNHARQDDGYSMAEKTEDDNRDLTV